jgi:transposase
MTAASLIADDVEGKVMDHHGLVAVTIEELGIREKIDAILPLEPGKGSKITMGNRVIGMILNGLGFMDDRLYLFSKFLENKPVERLMGKDVKAEYFTDDALGRCLDVISEYGPTKFFTAVSFAIGIEHDLIGSTMRTDTTTLIVYGDYDEKDHPLHEGACPKHGHSKIKRPDFKQMILHLATTGAANLPIWMEAHSGNASDKKTLIEAASRIEEFKDQLHIPNDFLYVGDSAMYSNAVKEGGDMKWLSRVPENIKEAKLLVELPEEDIVWTRLPSAYKMQCIKSQYGDVAQRWALIYSKQAFDREVKTLEKNIAKEKKEAGKILWHLSKELFECKLDAEKKISEFKSFKYHKASFEVKQVMKYSKKGRPKKDDQPQEKGFKIDYKLDSDEEKQSVAKRRKGRFILATNQIDKKRISDSEKLSEYKKKKSTESGFQFIKDRAFELDSIFLKNPGRINALMAVMCLCLLVYGFSEYQLRATLKDQNETLTSQSGIETQKPCMK